MSQYSLCNLFLWQCVKEHWRSTRGSTGGVLGGGTLHLSTDVTVLTVQSVLGEQ